MANGNDIASFTNHDRLGVSAFGSFLFHIVIILAVSFTVPKMLSLDKIQILEITLVNTRSDKAPANADYLAQHNQEGGGTQDKGGVIGSPIPVNEVSNRESESITLQPQAEESTAHKRDRTDIISVAKSDRQITTRKPQPKKRRVERVPLTRGYFAANPKDQERTQLNAEISRFWKTYLKKPRVDYLTARTREYKNAVYEEAWALKVERVGNLNYPEGARRRRLSGYLRLAVALNADGTIHSTNILRSSGHKLLDDAAVRIVNLASPYAPFPPQIRAENEILYIIRTWRFNEGSISEISR